LAKHDKILLEQISIKLGGFT